MKPKTFKQLALLSAILAVGVGIVYAADYATFAEASSAARIQYEQKNYAEAQKIVEQSISLAKTPQDGIKALIRLGGILNQRKLYDEARKRWAAVLEVPEATPSQKIDARQGIAITYSQEGQWDKSNAEFQKLLDDPNFPHELAAGLHLAKSINYQYQGNVEGERKELSTVFQDTSVNAFMRSQAARLLGQTFVETEDYQAARDALNDAADLSESGTARAMILSEIAATYKTQGNAKEEQRAYEQARLSAITQAEAYEANKQYTDARVAQQYALSLGQLPPIDDMRLRVKIAQNLVREGRPAEARIALDTISEQKYPAPITPEEKSNFLVLNQGAQLLQAKTYLQEGNKAEAQKVIDALRQEKPLAPGMENAIQLALKAAP